MTAAVVTASCAIAAVGSYYLLSGQYLSHAKAFLRTGVVAGATASALMICPTGHGNAQQVFEHNPSAGVHQCGDPRLPWANYLAMKT